MVRNCFFGMVDNQRVFSIVSSWNYCQKILPSPTSSMPWAGFKHAQNLISDFAEWCSAVVITTTPQHHIGISVAKRNMILVSKYEKRDSLFITIILVQSWWSKANTTSRSVLSFFGVTFFLKVMRRNTLNKWLPGLCLRLVIHIWL